MIFVCSGPTIAASESRPLLDELRGEARPLRDAADRACRGSRPQCLWSRWTAAITRIKFDPFMVHLVRVVDTSKNEHCFEAGVEGAAWTRAG